MLLKHHVHRIFLRYNNRAEPAAEIGADDIVGELRWKGNGQKPGRQGTVGRTGISVDVQVIPAGIGRVGICLTEGIGGYRDVGCQCRDVLAVTFALILITPHDHTDCVSLDSSRARPIQPDLVTAVGDSGPRDYRHDRECIRNIYLCRVLEQAAVGYNEVVQVGGDQPLDAVLEGIDGVNRVRYIVVDQRIAVEPYQRRGQNHILTGQRDGDSRRIDYDGIKVGVLDKRSGNPIPVVYGRVKNIRGPIASRLNQNPGSKEYRGRQKQADFEISIHSHIYIVTSSPLVYRRLYLDLTINVTTGYPESIPSIDRIETLPWESMGFL